MIQVLIVDDQAVVQAGLAASVGSDPEIEVVGQASNLVEALTPRELDVLALVVKGLNNREIGEQLYLATGIVRNHVSEIMGKMAV